MKFSVSRCERCGEPIYEGNGVFWFQMTGIMAKQDRAYRVSIDLGDGNGVYQYTLCHSCYKLLLAFPQSRKST